MDSAFRLIPLRPCDYELFGMQWEGKFYYDKFLPFGLRSAPFLFNQLSEAVKWLLLGHCGISFVYHILDDFLVIEPPSPIAPHNLTCQQSLSSMLLTFKNLGIPSHPKRHRVLLQPLNSWGLFLILTAWRHAFLLIRSNVSLPVSLNLKAEGPAHSRNYSLLLAL